MLFTYLARELRRRSKQAIVIALGLGIGVALVITVSAASAGVKTAQTQVLHSLYGVGTDITVSQTGDRRLRRRRVPLPPRRRWLGHAPEGRHPFLDQPSGARPGIASLDASMVATVAKVSGVSAAAGGLSLNDTTISGTIGSFGFGGGGGGGSGAAGHRP